MAWFPLQEKMNIQKSYLICATPRSGSFLLCEALKNTGLAGRPEEYFTRDDKPPLKERWSPSVCLQSIAEDIEQGTTSNGVFGVKIMRSFFDAVVGKLRLIPGTEGLTVPALLETVFPNLRYLFITRRDKVRQAVSYAKALQTDVWTVYTKIPPLTNAVAFNFKQIDYLVQLVLTYEAVWQQYFENSGIRPFTVVYEDLVPKYEETAIQILEYLNIPVPERLMFAERYLQRQTDAVSEEWVERYQELKQAQLETA